MPYTVLYRKKRPRTFSEMVGQPHIVEALRNQLRSGQTSHAYLFCGTRGTGKTTTAKIMARAINCTDLQDGDPCNHCAPCLSILADRCLDVAEIDAASNNGVENIRDLRDEVKYPPTECSHKVYIIDEVHMLSTSAFNALLKTLEEPPPNVVFILATTDPQKVPVTVLSRCQRYDFRRIKAPEIVTTLAGYMKEENHPFENEALEYIAYHCDGAMRDALSLLDQALSLRPAPDAPLTLAAVRDLLGAVDRALLFDFTDALSKGDGFGLLSMIDDAAKEGRDMAQLASDLVRHFRDALVASLITGTDGLDVSAEMAAKLKEQGERVTPKKLMGYIKVFSDALRELRFAPHKRTALEVCALGVCMPVAEVATISAAAAPVQVAPVQNAPVKTAAATTPVKADSTPPPKAVLPPAPKAKTAAIAETAPPPQEDAPPRVASPAPPPPPEATLPAPADILSAIISEWPAICKSVANPLRSRLNRCRTVVQGAQIQIICDNEAELELIKKNQSIIRQAIAERYNLITPPNLAFTVGEAYNKPAKTADDTREPLQPISPPLPEPEPAATKENDADDDDWSAFGQPTLDEEAPW